MSVVLLTSMTMGQNQSNTGYTQLKEKEVKKESNESSKWKEYSEKFSTNTHSYPEHQGYKKLK